MKFKNLGILFENIALNNKNNCFVLNKNQSFSFEEVNYLSNKILNFFKINQIGENDIVSLEYTKNIFSLSCIIACLKGGIAYSFIELFSAKKRVEDLLMSLDQKKLSFFLKNLILKKIYIFQKKI